MTGGVTVLGAGVAGLCVATELARRGMAVRVVDREAAPGPHACSWWAGGMLAPDVEAETADPEVVRLGRGAADWWEAAGVPVARAGTLVVALGRDRRELDRFARRTAGHRWLDARAVSALEPELAGRFDRALMFDGEAHLDPRAALGILREGLLARGVRFVAGDGSGSGPARSPGPVIDCRGLAARDMLPDLRGVKGEMAVLRAPGIALSRTVRLLHPRFPLYIVPRGDGGVMLGATQIEAGERGRVTVRSVLELLSAAHALHPGFGEAEVLELGADARPAFPDNLPRVREAGGRIHVNGLFRHGFLLAPALARDAAERVCGRIRRRIEA